MILSLWIEIAENAFQLGVMFAAIGGMFAAIGGMFLVLMFALFALLAAGQFFQRELKRLNEE